MNLDDKVCFCYHVPLRKLINFARREKLQRPSQMSQCLGAGTGCGWCIPILKKIYQQCAAAPTPVGDASIEGLPDSMDSSTRARADYLKSQEKNSF